MRRNAQSPRNGGNYGRQDDKRRPVGLYRFWRRVAPVQPDAERSAGGHVLGGGENRPPLDADQQGSRRRHPRCHVAAREGRRNPRPPDRRAARAGRGAYTLWLGEAHPHHQLVASQVVRPMRQHPRLSVKRDVADEQARHALYRRNRPDLMHGLELSWLRHRQRRQPRRGVSA